MNGGSTSRTNFLDTVDMPYPHDIKDDATRLWAEQMTAVLADIINNFATTEFASIHEEEILDTGPPNTTYDLTHHLRRVPTKFIAVYTDKASATLYDEGTAWTATHIFLKCSAANAHIKLLIY